jgi:ornithine cyclodeaminase
MKIVSKADIQARFDASTAVALIEEAFKAMHRGQAQVPPVQNLVFPEAHGDCCIKSGYIGGSDIFVVKASAGFYRNPALGLPSNHGWMAVFSALTGEPVALLQDEGWLTCMRTALAGRIVARLLAPEQVDAIGIVGTGEQARLQLDQLRDITPCRTVHVWGRNDATLKAYAEFAQALGFRVCTTQDARSVAAHANLIVTTTPSRAPLLMGDWIRPGTHITAVGADSPGKQELDKAIVASADIVLVDSLKQCRAYGEISHALSSGLLDLSKVVELGAVLATGSSPRLRSHAQQITVADLTGVAVQDVAIAGSVLAR